MREMRRQQEELQTRLREELQRKEELEQQIIVDQRRIRALEIRLKVLEKKDKRMNGKKERWNGGRGVEGRFIYLISSNMNYTKVIIYMMIYMVSGRKNE